ncbi:hypothetical protein [Natronorubrum sp. FCH18a]
MSRSPRGPEPDAVMPSAGTDTKRVPAAETDTEHVPVPVCGAFRTQ